MNDKDGANDGTPPTPGQLCFMLSQLASDLTELTEGLEKGAVPYDVGVAGARTQLNWGASASAGYRFSG